MPKSHFTRQKAPYHTRYPLNSQERERTSTRSRMNVLSRDDFVSFDLNIADFAPKIDHAGMQYQVVTWNTIPALDFGLMSGCAIFKLGSTSPFSQRYIPIYSLRQHRKHITTQSCPRFLNILFQLCWWTGKKAFVFD